MIAYARQTNFAIRWIWSQRWIYTLTVVLILQLFRPRITTPFQGVLLTMLEIPWTQQRQQRCSVKSRGQKQFFSALRLCLTNAQFMQNFLSCAEFEMDHKRTLAWNTTRAKQAPLQGWHHARNIRACSLSQSSKVKFNAEIAWSNIQSHTHLSSRMVSTLKAASHRCVRQFELLGTMSQLISPFESPDVIHAALKWTTWGSHYLH